MVTRGELSNFCHMPIFLTKRAENKMPSCLPVEDSEIHLVLPRIILTIPCPEVPPCLSA